MTSRFRYLNWTIAIDGLVIAVVLSYFGFLYDCVWIYIVGGVALYVFMCFISIVTIKENQVAIKYPFRLFFRNKTIDISNIIKILFNNQNGKAAPECIRFYCKDIHYIVYMESWRNYYPMLFFFKSKGIDVIIKGTENNSIEDLR